MKAPPSLPPVEKQFAQKLAANDKKDRDKAVKKLKKWLGARSTEFPHEDMMRIWKGLFYCFWMSDKPLIQEELAENISSMISSFQTMDNSLAFITCFAETFQREWFGIDRWRMDKTMMFVRRFLRHVFKLASSNDWEEGVVIKIVDIFRKFVILTSSSSSSLGFQLHFTDVFLEELAKVGGEDVPVAILEAFIQPFVELMTVSNDERLRDHTEERIFNHLLRQSDPGIQYQAEEDGVSEDNEVLDEESDEGSDKEEDGINGEETNGDGEAPQDPRAGRVDVIISQMSVNYSKIAEDLFKLGSGESVRKRNRDALYRISKKFKDVSEDIFPLGPNLSELEIDIPKTSVKKATADLFKRNEKLRKENLENKQKAKELAKQKKLTKDTKEDTSEDEDTNDNNELEESTQKRTSESDNDDVEEPLEKKPKREAQKKKKQERKRLKREAALKESLEKSDKERKLREQLDHDLIVKEELDKKTIKVTNGQNKTVIKKRKNDNLQITTEHISPAKKIKPLLSPEELPKKKKKKKVKGTLDEDVKGSVGNNENGIDENKTKVTDEENNEDITPVTNGSTPKGEKVKPSKKLKKKNKALHRIDSDICFSAPSLSQTNLTRDDVEEKQTAKLEAILEVSTPEVSTEQKKKKKAMKKYKAETSLITNAKLDTPSRAEKLDFGAPTGKVFEETEWDSPLQLGEKELVMPNKKYKGQIPLAPPKETQPSESETLPGFPTSQITPAKSFTGTFLKRAMSKSMSKSVTPKKAKKDMLANLQKVEKCSSEPRKKKINFALTQNKSQDFVDHLKAVKSSPQTPHDPRKNPEKTLLKKRKSLESGQASLNPVGLNTQLNGRSKTAKHLVKKRASAMDFF